MVTAQANWADLDGYAVSRNMPPLDELPIDRFCNFIWYMMTKNADEREREKIKSRLWMPPRGEVVEHPNSPWSRENETNALAAFKSQAVR